jgi:hypothetical protein
MKNAAAFAGAILFLAVSAWSAESVTALSAPFFFGAATRTTGARQQLSGSTLLSRAAGADRLTIAWHMGQDFQPGMLTLTALSGAVVKRVAVLSPEGSITLRRRDGLAAGLCLARITSGAVTRTITVLAP